MVYAEITNGVITNVVVAEPAYAATQGLVEIDSVIPPPAIGWTYDGSHFSPPPPTAPDPAQVAVTQAVTTLQTLDTEAPAIGAQLQADMVSAANWTALTPAQQQAIVGRMLTGFGTLMTALQAHVTATGVLSS